MRAETVILLLVAMVLQGCTALLPRSKEVTASPWESYGHVQQTFDYIVPGKTTTPELTALQLDPLINPNIAILNYSDVMRRFLPNASLSIADLDIAVRDCVSAKTVCVGYEINQKSVRKHRNGSFWADIFGFRRETHITGWKFSGLILIKEGVVIYKLTGGQPAIVEQEETTNPLGPIQGIGQKLFSWL